MENELREEFPAKERRKRSRRTGHFNKSFKKVSLHKNIFLYFMRRFLRFLLTKFIG